MFGRGMSGGIGGDRQMSGKGLNMSNNDLLPRGGCVGKYMVDNKTCLNLSDQRGMRGKVWDFQTTPTREEGDYSHAVHARCPSTNQHSPKPLYICVSECRARPVQKEAARSKHHAFHHSL